MSCLSGEQEASMSKEEGGGRYSRGRGRTRPQRTSQAMERRFYGAEGVR
jgi:hypothetical protein